MQFFLLQKRFQQLLFLLMALLMMTLLVVLHTVTPHHEETRYLGVAWEMFLQHHVALPLLNGQPYPDKPPLLFWLIQAGWWVFGVNSWWPQMIPLLAAVFALFLVRRLSLFFWPQDFTVAWMAPLVLLGMVFWAWYLPYIRFDVLLVCFTLMAWLGLLTLDRGGRYALVWMTLGVGLGILTKGPVIFLYLLGPLCAYRWWRVGCNTRQFFVMSSIAIGLGILMAATWVVPAALQGGALYRDAIFWGQEAGRVTGRYSHGHWYYYVLQLPLCLLPWIVWPRLWQGIFLKRALRWEPATRFILIAVASIILLFTMIAEKGNRYIMVVYPLLALLIANVLSQIKTKEPAFLAWVIGGILVVLASVLWWLPQIMPAWSQGGKLYQLSNIPPWFVGVIALVGAVVWVWRPKTTAAVTVLIALTAVIVVAVDAVGYRIQPQLDLHPAAQQLAVYQQQKRPIAFVGEYIDQFQFFGRLKIPLVPIGAHDCVSWAKQHPRGIVVQLLQRHHGFQPIIHSAEQVRARAAC